VRRPRVGVDNAPGGSCTFSNRAFSASAARPASSGSPPAVFASPPCFRLVAAAGLAARWVRPPCVAGAASLVSALYDVIGACQRGRRPQRHNAAPEKGHVTSFIVSTGGTGRRRMAREAAGAGAGAGTGTGTRDDYADDAGGRLRGTTPKRRSGRRGRGRRGRRAKMQWTTTRRAADVVRETL